MLGGLCLCQPLTSRAGEHILQVRQCAHVVIWLDRDHCSLHGAVYHLLTLYLLGRALFKNNFSMLGAVFAAAFVFEMYSSILPGSRCTSCQSDLGH